MSSRRLTVFSAAATLVALAAACAPATTSPPSAAAPASHASARALLDSQQAAWNRHDLEGFLAGYRKDEHVVFVTREGSSRGYADLERRYRTSYNAPEKFGVLTFDDIACSSIDETSVLVQGAWRLARATDKPRGRFVLVVCRFPEGWRIVSDYTTVDSTGG